MTSRNRLARPVDPSVEVTPQERCDQLNAYLRGERPAEYGDHAGKYLYPPRTDLSWIVHNDRPTSESVARMGER